MSDGEEFLAGGKRLHSSGRALIISFFNCIVYSIGSLVDHEKKRGHTRVQTPGRGVLGARRGCSRVCRQLQHPKVKVSRAWPTSSLPPADRKSQGRQYPQASLNTRTCMTWGRTSPAISLIFTSTKINKHEKFNRKKTFRQGPCHHMWTLYICCSAVRHSKQEGRFATWLGLVEDIYVDSAIFYNLFIFTLPSLPDYEILTYVFGYVYTHLVRCVHWGLRILSKAHTVQWRTLHTKFKPFLKCEALSGSAYKNGKTSNSKIIWFQIDV